MDLQEIVNRNKSKLDSPNFKRSEDLTKNEVIDLLMRQKMRGESLDRGLVQRLIILENNHQDLNQFLQFLEEYQPEPSVVKESMPKPEAAVFAVLPSQEESVMDNPDIQEEDPEAIEISKDEPPTIVPNEPETYMAFLRSYQTKKNWFEYKVRSDEEFGREKVQEEPASETLAKLLAQQGHTSQAIDMYEKLSLKNPEKKAYFADAIEKLKNR